MQGGKSSFELTKIHSAMHGAESHLDSQNSNWHVLPKPHDDSQRARYWELWSQKGAPHLEIATDDTTNRIGTFAVSEVLDCLFGNSPYLSKAAIRHPKCVEKLAQMDPDLAWQGVTDKLLSEVEAVRTDVPTLMKCLRTHKEQAALLIAICDIANLWDLEKVTTHLSAFADLCVQLTLSSLLSIEARSGVLSSNDEQNPMKECGLFVLALGKLGAKELNYSSDIDLMVLYDPESISYTGKKAPQEFAIKLTKNLVKILDDRTPDGYVFRTDLRLRPDPASTAVAVTTDSAELYYESWGQNWERSTLIKARCIAGDTHLADQFLNNLVPYIWRKSLDFYAIQDIHSIKRQIYTAKGGEKIDVLGHNIKTGRGGIREIEFYVQIQQLIWGGRIPELRTPQTLAGLVQLSKEDLIEESAKTELSESYDFLRRLEHRLQMINDEQTQTIPDTKEKSQLIATFLGFDSVESFSEAVKYHLRQVERHYAGLFEDAPDLTIDGNLVFTGADHDPDTLDTLENLGFSNPEAVSQIIRTWHHGRYRATRSTRSRQILTELVPTLLSSFAKTTQPDRAFLKFDQSLQKLPAGVQLFSIFYSRPEVLDLVAEIMGDAPILADYLTASIQRLDYVLEPDFFDPIPDWSDLKEDLQKQTSYCQDFETVLDTCVRWTNDFRFRIGVQILRDIIAPIQGSTALTNVTEVVINVLAPYVAKEFETQFGTIEGGSIAILAYGKLGAYELMPSSDLDLVIIYKSSESADSQGGKRSLPASAYYIRLAQRLVSVLTVMTAEGRLFDVDLRLRPSGDQGPFASNIEAFEKYHATESWIWEHLALTKARVIFATNALDTDVQSKVNDVLIRSHDKAAVRSAVTDMRERIEKEFGKQSETDIKRMTGGLMDAEFLIQFYALTVSGEKHKKLPTKSLEIVEQLMNNGDLEQSNGHDLQDAIKLWHSTRWLLRLTLGQDFLPDEIPAGLEKRLNKVANTSDLKEFHRVFQESRDKIARLIEIEFGASDSAEESAR